MKTSAHIIPKVLLVGYNGANNTGAEARLLATIEDIRTILGSEVFITVPTLNEYNLRRYLKEEPNLRIAPIPAIFFRTLRSLIREHDLILLVEGSTYMDTWTSALLWFFLWAAHCAHAMGKPCLAYAVDAGDVSPLNRKLVQLVASKTDLIITRTGTAAERLKTLGVSAPIEVTADTAFTYRTNPSDNAFIQDVWPENSTGIAGIAAVDFYLWPVVIRLWDQRRYCYKWPYYFSHSTERRRSTDTLATVLAAAADRIIEKHDKSVALICMEELDEPLAQKIMHYLKNTSRAKIFSSRRYTASQMTILLRSLELLVASRFHAGVLSLAAQVPQTAVGHDRRLEDFYRDLGLPEFFIGHSTPNLSETLNDRIDRLFADTTLFREILSRRYEDFMAKSALNRELLRLFVKKHGWELKG